MNVHHTQFNQTITSFAWSAPHAVSPPTTAARSWLSRRARIEAPLNVHRGAARRTQVSKMEMAMTKSVVGFFVVAIVGMTQPAHAQVTLDVAKVTCDQWAGYKITNPQNIALWVSGYFNGTRGNTVLDTQRLTADTQKMRDFCLTNPQVPILQAVEKVIAAPAK